MQSPLKFSSLIVTSGILRAAQLQDVSIPRLIVQAERLYLARNTAELGRITGALSVIGHPGAFAVARFYRAMMHFRAGQDTQAVPLLESVAGCASAPKYRARAIQSLGSVRQFANNHEDAFRLYREAIRAALRAGDLVACVRAGITISELRSREGDHAAALDELRLIRPAVELLGRSEPYYLHLFSNEVAFELLQTGRLDQARRFARFAISSPLASAYPEWKETALQIEQQTARKNSVAVSVAPEPRARQARPKLLLVVLRFSPPVRVNQLIRFRRRINCNNPTLALVVLVARIRAPSF